MHVEQIAVSCLSCISILVHPANVGSQHLAFHQGLVPVLLWAASSVWKQTIGTWYLKGKKRAVDILCVENADVGKGFLNEVFSHTSESIEKF